MQWLRIHLRKLQDDMSSLLVGESDADVWMCKKQLQQLLVKGFCLQPQPATEHCMHHLLVIPGYARLINTLITNSEPVHPPLRVERLPPHGLAGKKCREAHFSASSGARTWRQARVRL
jgi:hypothetical protein